MMVTKTHQKNTVLRLVNDYWLLVENRTSYYTVKRNQNLVSYRGRFIDNTVNYTDAIRKQLS
jgi:hypothetical protein